MSQPTSGSYTTVWLALQEPRGSFPRNDGPLCAVSGQVWRAEPPKCGETAAWSSGSQRTKTLGPEPGSGLVCIGPFRASTAAAVRLVRAVPSTLRPVRWVWCQALGVPPTHVLEPHAPTFRSHGTPAASHKSERNTWAVVDVSFACVRISGCVAGGPGALTLGPGPRGQPCSFSGHSLGPAGPWSSSPSPGSCSWFWLVVPARGSGSHRGGQPLRNQVSAVFHTELCPFSRLWSQFWLLWR